MRTKSIVLTAISAALVILLGYYFYNLGLKNAPQQNKTATSTQTEKNTLSSDFKLYSDDKISFEYPKILSISNEKGAIKVNHAVNYKHENFCDFKGDGGYLNKFTDFNLTLDIVNENTKEYLSKSEWPGFKYASENPFRAGDLNGYKISEGIEGCGQNVYYFNINEKKTLVVKNSYIPEYNSINNRRDEFLAIPGIITEERNDKFLMEILSTIIIK